METATEGRRLRGTERQRELVVCIHARLPKLKAKKGRVLESGSTTSGALGIRKSPDDIPQEGQMLRATHHV